MTPLMMAAANGHANVVEYLIETMNADVTIRDQNGHNCLDLAIMKDHQLVAEFNVLNELYNNLILLYLINCAIT